MEHTVTREILFARIPPPRASKIGIAPEDINRVRADQGLVEDIIGCVQSEDETDVTFGLWFLEHLGARADFLRVAQPSLPVITGLLRSLVVNSDSRVRACAIRCFVVFRARFPDYSETMRSCLVSSNLESRWEVLAAAPTYLRASELDALLLFRDDSTASETGGMGGPLRYTLRDFALEIAERIAQKSFANGDCFERLDGSVVSWRSWSAFTNWLESRKKWSLSRLWPIR